MRRRRALLVTVLCLLGALACFAALFAAEPCAYVVVKHERHTSTAQKRAVFLKAGVPYDKAHRPLYVVDHVVPLELSGLDDVSNMQLQTKADGHAKDLVENFLARCVCHEETPLAVAQRAVVAWRSVTLGTCPKEAP